MIHLAEYIGEATSVFDVDHKEVVKFLDTKIKPEQIDSDKKWITTWNDYLWRIKLFFRWFQNKKVREINGQKVKADDVVRACERELGRCVYSLSVISDGYQLTFNETLMIVSGGVLSQCLNPSSCATFVKPIILLPTEPIIPHPGDIERCIQHWIGGSGSRCLLSL